MGQYNAPWSEPVPRGRGGRWVALRLGRWRFEPGLWPTLAALCVFPGLLWLGLWQLDRAAQKAQLEARFEQRVRAPAIEIDSAGARELAADELTWRRVILDGHYDPRYRFLLDNQVVAERPGYFVYVPFILARGGAAILVNQGWVPVGGDRRSIPPIDFDAAAERVEGMAKSPPATGLFLGGEDVERMDRSTFRVQRIDVASIEASTGLTLMPFVVRLDAAQGSAMVRSWSLPGLGRERHLGYAFQWFALAGALVCLYAGTNLRREREP